MTSGHAREVLALALDTLRANKLRSGLTVLGIVIGITALVGMTALVRGFDQSLRDSIRELGPNTIFVAKFSGLSLSSGRGFAELARRPNITKDDARAIETLAPSVGKVDTWFGAMGEVQERVNYAGQRSKVLTVMGATEEFASVNFIRLELGRLFTEAEVSRRRRVAILGRTPYEALFEPAGIDPVGKRIRVGAIDYTVIGVFGKRPSVGTFNTGQDDFVLIPVTTHETLYGGRTARGPGGLMVGRSAMIALVPKEGATRDQALREVQEIMRIRHRLTLDQEDDFDLATQDAILQVWDRVSGATFLGLIVISSIALMVGGIGVMAIMMIAVTERTREIGLRKALGARRRDILLQFLAEASVLTLVGWALGVAAGAGIGLTASLATGFPVSLPWWSFAIGLGFSGFVGIFFGMVPAVRASRLDPIEALRHE